MKKEEKGIRARLAKATSIVTKIECWNELAALYRNNDVYDVAIKYFKEAVSLHEGDTSNKSRFDACFSLRGLAEIYAELGKRTLSLNHAEKYRNTALSVPCEEQIQLSYHVTAWIYQKLYLKQSTNLKDLEEAKKWCEKSLEYLKTVGYRIDADREAVNRGGDSAKRKAMLNRLCSEVAASLGLKEEAEKNWKLAHSYAERRKDSKLIFELVRVQLDFEWLNPLKVAEKLFNIAPKADKGEALMTLGQAYIYESPDDLSIATRKLLECMAIYKKDMLPEDVSQLHNSIVFVYRTSKLLKAVDTEKNRIKRRKLFEKIADSYADYSNRPEVQEAALKYYKKMLKESHTNKEKASALVSLAVTYVELKDYFLAAENWQKVISIEQLIQVKPIKMLDSKVNLFISQCNGKLKTAGYLRSELDILLDQMPIDSNRIRDFKINLFDVYSKYLYSLNERVEADRYKALMEEIKAKSEQFGSQEMEEEEECSSDKEESLEEELDEFSILKHCEELARNQSTRQSLEADRHKKINQHGETWLHVYSRTDDSQKIKQLIEYGYNVNARDNGGWTPLSEAVSYGQLENVRLLLSAKATVDVRSKEVVTNEENSAGAGMTPLMEACDHGFLSIARLLLKYGASVTIENDDKWRCVDFLRNWINKSDEDSEMMEEAEKLALLMEKMQREKGIPVHTSLPERRRKSNQMIRSLINKNKTKLRRSISPNEKNLNDYRRTMDNLGGKARRGSGLREDDIFDEEDRCIDENIRTNEEVIEMQAAPKRRSLQSSRRSNSELAIITQAVDDRSRIINVESDEEEEKVQNTQIHGIGNGRKRRMRDHASRNENKRISGIQRPSSITPIDNLTDSDNYCDDMIQTNRDHFESQRILPKSANHNSPSTSSKIVATLFFEAEDGSQLKQNKMIFVDKNSTFGSLYQTPEFSGHSFEIKLKNGTEVADDIPIYNLPLPLEFLCKKVTAPSLQQYINNGGQLEEVMSCLKKFDENGEIDIRWTQADGELNLLLRSILASGKSVRKLAIDYADVAVNDCIVNLAKLFSLTIEVSAISCGLNCSILQQMVSIEEITSYSNLKYLDLSHNELDCQSLAIILNRFPLLNNLSLVDINIDNPQHLITSIASLTELQFLDISYNQWLNGSFVEEMLPSLVNLVELRMIANDLSSTAFQHCWMKKLSKLNISGCNISNWDSFVDFLALSNVKILDISCTSIRLSHIQSIIGQRLGCSTMNIRMEKCFYDEDVQDVISSLLSHGTSSNMRFCLSPSLSSYIINNPLHTCQIYDNRQFQELLS